MAVSYPSFREKSKAKAADRNVRAKQSTAHHITEPPKLLCYPDPSFFLPCGSSRICCGDSSLMFHSIGSELAQNPILTLFVVIGLGYLLGELNLFSFRLGVAGVLFMGIAVGALSPDIHIPEAVASLGLILFVYTLGIQSGPAFFESFRKKGSRDTLLAVTVLAIGFLMTMGAARILHLTGPKAAGMYAGSLTSTPTLAAVRDRVKELTKALPPEQAQASANEPVVAYGLTYPIGVIGVLLLFQIARKVWRVQSERRRAHAGDSHTRLRGGESGGRGTHAAGNHAAPQRAGIRDQPNTARRCTAGAAE